MQNRNLSCAICDLSLDKFLVKTKKDRSGRKKKVFDGAESEPAVHLLADAPLMFMTLTDLIVATLEECIENGILVLEEIVKELPKRRYFDPVSQSFITPNSITKVFLSFVIQNDPYISNKIEFHDGIVRIVDKKLV